MGSLYKRRGSRQWMMAVVVSGRQVCKSSRTTNKRLAKKRLSKWETDVYEGRYRLLKSQSPVFDDYADECLTRLRNNNTRKRYKTSIEQLKRSFGGRRLADITADLIDEYKQLRLDEKTEAATINHDLRVLRRILRLAEKKRLISRTPFVEVEFLPQNDQRPPHIVTFSEEQRILSIAQPFIRMLIILLLYTGLRSHREALVLKWDDIDFENELIRVRQSKTRAGIRNVPLPHVCKVELQRWRTLLGSDFSEFVFPNMHNPLKPRQDVRDAWAKTLNDAKLGYFWLYCCRHTYASRLSAAGVPDLFVAQMMGHAGTSTLHKYSKAIDEYRREAIRKLEQMRDAHTLQVGEGPTSIN